MSRAIWKYDLSLSLVHEMPMGARPLHAGYQDGRMHAWFLVDPDQAKLARAVIVAGTGWTLPHFVTPEMHIASAPNPSNGNIWHVFDLGYLQNYHKIDQSKIMDIQSDNEEEGGDAG